MHPVLLVGIVTIFSVSGQMCFKAGVKKLGLKKIDFVSIARNFFAVVFKPLIFFGFILFGLSFLLWLMILSRFDLSYVVPMMSLSYAAIMFVSASVFKEKVSWLRWLGVVIICAGVWFISLS